MIDWIGLGFGALWVAGLALALTTVSVAGWIAHERGVRPRAVLAGPRYVAILDLAAALFCLGMAYGGYAWWQTALWLVLAAAFAWDARRAMRVRR